MISVKQTCLHCPTAIQYWVNGKSEYEWQQMQKLYLVQNVQQKKCIACNIMAI